MKKISILLIVVSALTSICHAEGYETLEQQLIAEAAKGNTPEAHMAQMAILMRASQERAEKARAAWKQHIQEWKSEGLAELNAAKPQSTQNINISSK